MSRIDRFVPAAAISVAAFFCLLGTVFAAEGNLWQTDFEAAKAKAKAENKFLLLDFTGSDWCTWCTRLKDEVFDKETFRTEAPKQFVLVELDFPHQKKLTPELTKQNEGLAKQYKIQGYPEHSAGGFRRPVDCAHRLPSRRPGEVRKAPRGIRRCVQDHSADESQIERGQGSLTVPSCWTN